MGAGGCVRGARLTFWRCTGWSRSGQEGPRGCADRKASYSCRLPRSVHPLYHHPLHGHHRDNLWADTPARRAGLNLARAASPRRFRLPLRCHLFVLVDVRQSVPLQEVWPREALGAAGMQADEGPFAGVYVKAGPVSTASRRARRSDSRVRTCLRRLEGGCGQPWRQIFYDQTHLEASVKPFWQKGHSWICSSPCVFLQGARHQRLMSRPVRCHSLYAVSETLPPRKPCRSPGDRTRTVLKIVAMISPRSNKQATHPHVLSRACRAACAWSVAGSENPCLQTGQMYGL